MIEQTIKQIRADFTDRIIVLCTCGNCLMARLSDVKFNIETKVLDFKFEPLGRVQEITVGSEFSTIERGNHFRTKEGYHFSTSPIKLDQKKPEVKFYD